MGQVYLAQLGCELLPEIREISLYCLVGTSSRDKVRRPPWRWAKTTVREFGAQDGSSPPASWMASPPCAGTTHIHIGAAALAQNQCHMPAIRRRGSAGVQAGKSGHRPPVASVQIMIKNVRIASLIGRVIKRQTSRHPAWGGHDRAVAGDRLRAKPVEIGDIDFTARAALVLEGDLGLGNP